MIQKHELEVRGESVYRLISVPVVFQKLIQIFGCNPLVFSLKANSLSVVANTEAAGAVQQ